MRRIIKASRQPDSLCGWKKKHKDEMGRPAIYMDIHRYPEVYQELKEILIKEQYFLCCYCCNSVSMATESSHIEHFIPRSADRSKDLDYHNLFISCNGYLEGTSTAYRESCGHRKNNWYDESQMISPLDPECEDIFVFLFDGSIEPRDEDIRASSMINRFGLNSYALKQVRKSAIDLALHNIGFLDGKDDLGDAGGLRNGSGAGGIESGAGAGGSGKGNGADGLEFGSGAGGSGSAAGSGNGAGVSGMESGASAGGMESGASAGGWGSEAGLASGGPCEAPIEVLNQVPNEAANEAAAATELLNEAIREEIEFNNTPSSEGKLPPFCDAVTYVLRELLA